MRLLSAPRSLGGEMAAYDAAADEANALVWGGHLLAWRTVAFSATSVFSGDSSGGVVGYKQTLGCPLP